MEGHIRASTISNVLVLSDSPVLRRRRISCLHAVLSFDATSMCSLGPRPHTQSPLGLSAFCYEIDFYFLKDKHYTSIVTVSHSAAAGESRDRDLNLQWRL